MLLLLGMLSEENDICESSWFSFHTSLIITGAKANSEIAAQTYHSLKEVSQFSTIQAMQKMTTVYDCRARLQQAKSDTVSKKR